MCLHVCHLCNLIACKQVHEQEGSELQSIMVFSKDLVVIKEIRKEKDTQGFEVDRIGVLNVLYNP